MDQAERTILECPVLSPSLRQSFSVLNAGDGSGGPRTLYFVLVVLVHNFVCIVHNFVCDAHNVVDIIRNFVKVVLNPICVLRNFAYVSRNGHIDLGGSWVDKGSA
jgi:hypothetical protein